MKIFKLACLLVIIGTLATAAEATIFNVSALPLPTSIVFLFAGLGGLALVRLWAD